MSNHNFLNTLDIFSTTEFLKINRQSSYKTKTGGVFTLLFIAVIILIFVMRIDSRSRGQRMNYKFEQRYNNNELAILNTSPSSDNNFMLGVLITSPQNPRGYGLDDFDVSIDIITETKGINPRIEVLNFYLQACTLNHFRVTPQILEKYKKQYNYYNYLCLPKDTVINLQESRDLQYYSQIKIQKCSRQTCNDQTQINQVLQNSVFLASTIFINSYISTTQLTYKTFYLQNLSVMSFNQAKFPQVNLLFSKYQVSTDRNYLTPIPENQILRQEGAFLKKKSDPIQKIKFDTQDDKFFVKINVRSSSQITILNRIDQRLIDIISYLGGLAATIFSIFQMIVSSYSSYAFEIEISRKIFKDSTEDILQQKHDQTQNEQGIQAKPAINYLTNFCQYIKDKVSCCFKASQKNDQFRKEFDKLIDIELIIQKLIVFQKLITKFAPRQLTNLQQSQKDYTFEEANNFRNYLSLFFKNQPDNNKQQKKHESNKKHPSAVNLCQRPLEINFNTYSQENISKDFTKTKIYDQNNGEKYKKPLQMNENNLYSNKMFNNDNDESMKGLR